MFDSTVPSNIPARKATHIAVYYNGLYKADPTEVSRLFPTARIYWIDVLGTAPKQCSILDIETGDANPNMVPDWVEARLEDEPNWLCRLYSNLSTWPDVKAFAGKLPVVQRAQIRYWIANPTEKAHLVPGSDATQYFWGATYDLSQLGPRWDS